MRDVRKMLKTLATSLNDLCDDGLIPTTAKNEVKNSQFDLNEDDPSIVESPSYERLEEKNKRFKSWFPFADGYNIDKRNGRISESSSDTRALRMQNPDWKDARGAVQEVHLHPKRTLRGHNLWLVKVGTSRAPRRRLLHLRGHQIYRRKNDVRLFCLF